MLMSIQCNGNVSIVENEEFEMFLLFEGFLLFLLFEMFLYTGTLSTTETIETIQTTKNLFYITAVEYVQVVCVSNDDATITNIQVRP